MMMRSLWSFKYAGQEHRTSMDSDLNYLKIPFIGCVIAISNSTSKLILKSRIDLLKAEGGFSNLKHS